MKAKNAELIGERRKDKERFDDAGGPTQGTSSNDPTSRGKPNLLESGEHKKLWEEAQKTVAEREAELSSTPPGDGNNKPPKRKHSQVRSVATSAMAQMGVFAPDQLYQLMSQKLKLNGEEVKAIDGGVEVSLAEFIGNLKNPGSGYEHFFSASRVSGMGTTPGSSSVTAGYGQPLRRPGTFTQIDCSGERKP